MTFRACDLNLGAKTGPRSGAASLRRRRAQADGSENTLRDADVQLHADAVSGLRSLIEQPTLLAAFLAHARAPPRRTSPMQLQPTRRGPCAQGRWRDSTKLLASDWAGVHWVYDTLITLLSGSICGLLWTSVDPSGRAPPPCAARGRGAAHRGAAERAGAHARSRAAHAAGRAAVRAARGCARRGRGAAAARARQPQRPRLGARRAARGHGRRGRAAGALRRVLPRVRGGRGRHPRDAGRGAC